MNRSEIQNMLLAHRPGVDHDADQAEALRQAERDPVLREWFIRHSAVQGMVRDKLREVTAPADLKRRLLEHEHKIVRPQFRRSNAVWLAAAACIAVLLCVGALVWRGQGSQGEFAECRDRLVRTAVRQYRMDVASNDPAAVRDYMRKRGAPADYAVPAGLQRLTLAGGGFLRWRSHPVSMVCFERSDKRMAYLFVVDRTAAAHAPGQRAEVLQISKLVTASWSEGSRTYILATEAPAEIEKLL